jgi:hypothetical protein
MFDMRALALALFTVAVVGGCAGVDRRATLLQTRCDPLGGNYSGAAWCERRQSL